MLAVLADHVLIIGILLGILVAAIPLGLMTFAVGFGIARMAAFLVYFGYFTFYEWRWQGQTPGKRLLDLRVIDDRGMNVDLFQSLVRNLIRIVDLMPFLIPQIDFLSVGLYGVGGLAALISPTHKRLGDWAAGTLVVRVRKRVMPSAIIAASEKYNTLLEDGSLRVRIRARLSLQDRETLLQLCLRRNELEFEARQALFVEAAGYLEGKLEIAREAFLSEEKFVQNIAAVALAEDDRRPAEAGRTPVGAARR
jgi:uncharacterized RDD family membrane protein YckC